MADRAIGNLVPFEQGNQAARRHGAFASLTLAPRAEELADYIRSVMPMVNSADDVSIGLLAGVLAQIEAATLYVAERGIVNSRGQPQPVLKHLSTMTNTAARLADRLGMTPSGRAALGLDLAKGEAYRRLTVTRLAALAEAGDGDGDR
jgi:hypothetical protein